MWWNSTSTLTFNELIEALGLIPGDVSISSYTKDMRLALIELQTKLKENIPLTSNEILLVILLKQKGFIYSGIAGFQLSLEEPFWNRL